MRCTLDQERFEFRVRIYQDDSPGSVPVVVLSDEPGNPGPSVRDALIHIAAAVWSEIQPALEDTAPVFITHEPYDHLARRCRGPAARFNLIRFRVVQPAWRRVLEPTVERLDDGGLATRIGPTAAAELVGWPGSAAPASWPPN
jgi:hypothetical protein